MLLSPVTCTGIAGKKKIITVIKYCDPVSVKYLFLHFVFFPSAGDEGTAYGTELSNWDADSYTHKLHFNL